ncbi:hypothetical protein [Bdellovibrio bacteriovorus]|uniref:hypothetical protein n=1 Tax=Bdellovibrio bacteriovorus TaxID=959 RepID=UPI003AA8788D
MKYARLWIGLQLVLTGSFAMAGAPEAQRVAVEAPECRSIQPFYWEVGNSQGLLAAGSPGKKYERKDEMKVASASKWIFAAYYVEVKKGLLAEQDKNLLLMRGGYDQFNVIPCALRLTVEACFQARSNSTVNPAHVGKFYYGGGSAQALAVNAGLGKLNRKKLSQEIESTLKNKFRLSYPNLALAGGAEMSAENYARFLQEILKGTYLIKDMLGADAICTSPATCKQAAFSPAKEDWKYSYHHWVETNGSQVEAYSSPGAFGFYPWISADKKTYGIVAREGRGEQAYWDSVQCGRAIRKAYFK